MDIPRIYHAYTSNDIPGISMDIPGIYCVDIHGISMDIPCIFTSMDISKDIPSIFHAYVGHLHIHGIYHVYAWYVPIIRVPDFQMDGLAFYFCTL